MKNNETAQENIQEQDCETETCEPATQDVATEPAANNSCQAPAGESVQLDLFGKPIEEATAKGKKNSKKTCGAQKASGNSCSTPAKAKELENDMERFVVLTSDNVQRSYPADMTLEQIREDLEREYPAYSAKNTNWYTEEQKDQNRYLCIPSYKSCKAG